VTARRFLSPLGVRLAIAFVAVAVAAVAVLAGLTLASATDQVSELVEQTHRADAHAAADAAARSYEQAGGWDDADLSSAAAVAARGQAELTIVDGDGEVLAAPATEAAEMMARMHGVEILDVPRHEAERHSVTVDGELVGAVELRFPSSHLPTPERQIRHALVRNAWIGAALAIAAAVGVAVVVARLVSRPIGALTSAATALASGRRGVRVGLGDAPGELGALSVAFDRMAAAVEEEDRLRRQIVADVAHEVRTPLTILQGTTEALVDGIVEPDPATLASLHEEVLRLTQLVGDLEILAAADAAGLRLDTQPADLASEVRAVIDTVMPAATAAGIRIDADLSPAPVAGDRRRLRQLATTLFANALAYTPAGGTITVRTTTTGAEAQLEVSDTGPGIDAADLPRVFDRFYRGRRTSGTSGAGIGLAVARELTAAHGGTITAGNTTDGGARFTVTLPGSRT
jgi:two-component system, OmpR family, sensor histidine kinase BaeS